MAPLFSHKLSESLIFGLICSCFICDITMKCKSYLRIHLKSHVSEFLERIKFKCDQCDKEFTSKAKLQYHVSETHAKENIKCDVCSKK